MDKDNNKNKYNKLKLLSLLFLTVLLCSCGKEENIPTGTARENTPAETERNDIPVNVSKEDVSANTAGKDISTDTGEGVLASFSAMDIENNIVSQDIFADSELTMVNIWGTFCSPCVEEMPILAEYHQEYADQGFQVVGIIIDVTDKNLAVKQNKLTTAKEIISVTGAGYTHLIPSKSLNSALLVDIQSVPYTIFVNSEGYQVGESYSGAKSGQEWKEIIDALLKKE